MQMLVLCQKRRHSLKMSIYVTFMQMLVLYQKRRHAQNEHICNFYANASVVLEAT